MTTERIPLKEWAETELGESCRLELVSGDASFRSYWRVLRDGSDSLIAMDAPPEKESVAKFCEVIDIFAPAGVNLPQIKARNDRQGYLLLSDFGGTTYLDALDERNATDLYKDAWDSLARIQSQVDTNALPPYTEEMLVQEMELYPVWYLGEHLKYPVSEEESATLREIFSMLAKAALAQPQVAVHRDYHSRNLMVCKPNPGILDFQDAVSGPCTYDMLSLLRDAYVSWPESQILDWLACHWEEARKIGVPLDRDFASYHRDFEWMGVQRFLKVIGIFSRLHHRDGKSAYLADIPRVEDYLKQCCVRYREFAPLYRIVARAQEAARG